MAAANITYKRLTIEILTRDEEVERLPLNALAARDKRQGNGEGEKTSKGAEVDALRRVFGLQAAPKGQLFPTIFKTHVIEEPA